MGLYSYPPNTEAVRFLIDQVIPQIYKMHPDIRLVVTGGNLPDSYPWLIKTGILPRHELNAVLGASLIGVSPIFRGSGTRLKILEYMAAGLPVVTTRKGAEGLSVDPDSHALFAEDAEEFQSALVRLLSDPELRRHLCIEGRELIRSRYEWIPVLRTFSSQIELGS
jgi:glycosyltransferase involved in cell wall biosynthesis